MPFLCRPIKRVAIALIIGLFSQSCLADPLTEAINVEEATQQAAAESQQKIDALSVETDSLLEQYRFLTRQTQNIKTESKHLQKVLATQQQEKASLQQQLKDVAVTQTEIMPLLLKMLDNLEQFIALDLPFLPEERRQRLAKLKTMMLRADVSKAEKFRRIIEAYQIENEYGNTIEAYKGEIEMNGNKMPVDFLRLGRVSLYYQRLDGSESGFWDKAAKSWQSLPDNYRNSIRNGLRIARKEAAPDLLTLPVPAAEEGK